MTAPGTPSWTADLWLRMRRHFMLKTLGISGFTWLFFIAYFHLLRHPAGTVTTMPLTALDAWIPFQPAALFAYLSLWLYVGIPPALQRNFRELVVYGLWIGALSTAGLTLFYLWPTAVPPRAPAVVDFPGFALLKGVDAAGNACPSMHVAVSIFSAAWLHHLLGDMRAPPVLRLLNAAWFLAIAWSTLAIQQHVVLDALAGALLGLAFAGPSLHWRHGKRAATAAVRPGAADIIAPH